MPRPFIPRRLLLAISILAMTAAAPADDPGPIHRLRLPGNPSIFSAAFSPDGETLYAVGQAQAINLWEILVYYWPEIGGTIVAVTVLLFLFVLRRVLRTPRLPGEPHCRRCNYCLKGAASDRCPECFTPTRRPRLGRTTRRRILPIAIPAVIALLGYAGAWVCWLPRLGWVGESCKWRSYDLYTAALAHGVNLTAWQRPVDNIYVIDVVPGTVTHILETSCAAWMVGLDIAVTPDGSGILLPLPEGLALLDAETGTVRRMLPNPVTPINMPSCWAQIAGFDDPGNVAYVVVLDEAADRTKVLRWDMGTSEASLLLSLACESTTAMNGQPLKCAHRVYRVPGGSPRFLELRSHLGVDLGAIGRPPQKSQVRYHIFGTNHEHLFTVDFDAVVPPFTGPGLSRDGSRTFLRDDERALAAYVLATGQPERARSLRRSGIGHTPCGPAQVGRMVISTWSDNPDGVRRGFAVADLESGNWIGNCSLPPDDAFIGIFVAPNGHFFAANGFLWKAKLPTGDFQHDLLIYDMRHLPDPADTD